MTPQNQSTDEAAKSGSEQQAVVQPTVLGTIIGKSTTREFSFQIENESKVFEYLKVYHRVFGDVLCQVIEITATRDDSIALCDIIGYRDPEGTIKAIRIPFDVGSRVLRADDDFIKSIIKLGDEHGALMGKLEGRNISVALDLRKILTKHVAVLAKSGAGKSYCVGVLIEEILERNVPLVIIDPHGEYGTLSTPNTDKSDVEKLKTFDLLPKSFPVNEYGDPSVTNGKPLKLSNKMTQQELVQMIPTKLTGAQIGILYSALKNIDQVSFDAVIASLNAEESNAKWGLINILEHLRTYNIFSNDPTPYDEIVCPGVCSIINLRGIPAEIQSIIVYKLTKDLFELRKRGAIPPFFLVLEEGHNFCPERSFGETTASKTIRTIASEGRKFGLGLCVISQRPARLDKSVISQCTTQIILKVTNPNDLKAISSSVEGLTAEAEKEIANLPIGTALITGIVEVPLLVNVRPRKTLHGGHSVDIFSEIDDARAKAASKPKVVRPSQTVAQQPITTPTITPAPEPARNSPVERNVIRNNEQMPQAPPKDQPDEAVKKPSKSTRTKTTAQQANSDAAVAQAQFPTAQTAHAVQNDQAQRQPQAQQQPPQQQTQQPQRTAAQPIAVLRPKKGILDQLLKEKPLSSVRQELIPAYLMTCSQGTEQFRLVVERIDGTIVTNIDTYSTKKLPDIKHLSKEELKILQDTYTTKSLGLSKELMADHAVQSLIEKGYLLLQADTIQLSEKYLFQKLSKVKSDDDLEFTRITDATPLEPKLVENEVRMMLAAFVSVKTATECYVLRIIVK